MWTWVSGASKTDQRGVYGAQGVVAATSKPGARSGAVGWIDSNGTLWLFGGEKTLGHSSSDYFNDLWKFEP